mmetsp:Transcript_22721/g.61997  ORF Transcript_22721/g.61997 Transcript_22721/m.61997 type:complete len:297 (-) Transcript_22721:2-892(-)
MAQGSVQPRKGVAREGRLRDGAAEGNHRQPPILQLGHPHLALALLVLGEEGKSEAVVACALDRVPLKDLLGATELDNCDPEENLEVHAHSAVELVVPVDGHGDGLEGVALTGDADEVRDDKAHPGEHRDAPVLQLRLAEEGHELGVLGEADRVELVGAPGALGAHEALSELSVVEEADARVLVGDGKLAAAGAARHTGLGRTALPAERRHANGCRGDRGRGCHASGLCGARRGQLLCRRHTKRWCRLDAVARGARHEGAAQRVHRRAARGKRHLGAHHGCRRGLAGGAPLGAVWEP